MCFYQIKTEEFYTTNVGREPVIIGLCGPIDYLDPLRTAIASRISKHAIYFDELTTAILRNNNYRYRGKTYAQYLVAKDLPSIIDMKAALKAELIRAYPNIYTDWMASKISKHFYEAKEENGSKKAQLVIPDITTIQEFNFVKSFMAPNRLKKNKVILCEVTESTRKEDHNKSYLEFDIDYKIPDYVTEKDLLQSIKKLKSDWHL